MNSSITVTNAQIPMLDLGLQHSSIRQEIKAAIDEVLDSNHFILGPNVKALEEEVAGYCERRFGVGVASGTDALILALRAAEIGPGDEVIVPSFTFIATADSVSLLGARPVFVDIDPSTFCMDPSQLNGKLSRRTKAVIPVHLYGQSADMESILDFAREHNLKVIEDNAQAIGATHRGKRTGSMGDIACLSFFPSKNLGAYGDGGMVLTDSEETARRLQSLRAHGTTKKYFSTEQGWNSRLDEIQAAILRVKLRHLDAWNQLRRSRAAYYERLLKHVSEVVCPKTADGNEHVFHQYTIRVANRDVVQKRLSARGVASTVYYPVPIHLQPIFQLLGYTEASLPNSELAAKEALSLPIYPELTDEQIEYVVEVLTAALKQ